MNIFFLCFHALHWLLLLLAHPPCVYEITVECLEKKADILH